MKKKYLAVYLGNYWNQVADNLGYKYFEDKTKFEIVEYYKHQNEKLINIIDLTEPEDYEPERSGQFLSKGS